MGQRWVQTVWGWGGTPAVGRYVTDVTVTVKHDRRSTDLAVSVSDEVIDDADDINGLTVTLHTHHGIQLSSQMTHLQLATHHQTL